MSSPLLSSSGSAPVVSTPKPTLSTVPRISELPLHDAPESPVAASSEPLAHVTPRTAMENALKLRSLEEKVRMLEAQLSQASPKVDGPMTPGKGMQSDRSTTSVLSVYGVNGRVSPIPDDVDTLEEDLEGDVGADGDVVEAVEDNSVEVPEELEGPALDASLSARLRDFGSGDEAESPISRDALAMQRPMTAEETLLTADELFILKVTENLKKLAAGRKPLVLVSTGAYNPIHLQHARMFYLARKVCAQHFPLTVCGVGLLMFVSLSPHAHSTL
jgi:hypothetical protein